MFLQYEPVNMELVLPLETDEFAGCKIRKTPEVPPRVSVYDLIAAVKGCSDDTARKDFARIRKDHPEVTKDFPNFKFGGQGQREIPITDARGVVVLVNLISGKVAAAFRLKAADIVVRALGGDETLVDEIRRNAAVQGTLPDDHPMRMFGQTVEAEAAKRKRSLDEDPQALAIRSKRMLLEEEQGLTKAEEGLAKAEQSLARTRVEGFVSLLHSLEGLYAQLSDNVVPGALQNIIVARTNATNRLLTAVGEIVQGSASGPARLALPAPGPDSRPAPPPAQDMVSRLTVLDMARELRMPPSQMTSKVLADVGLFARDGWFRKGFGDLAQKDDDAKAWVRSTYKDTGAVNKRGFVVWEKETTDIEPDWSMDTLTRHRIRYSSAFAGQSELGLAKAHNVWTYPATTGKQVLREAFVAAGAWKDDLYD